MRRCPHHGFCLASRWTNSRIPSGPAGVPRYSDRSSGDHGPVGPVQFRAGDLTAQDCDLMPQYQDLHLFGDVAAREQRQPAEQPDHGQKDQAEEDECRG
jgi:hypothetical protein